MDAALKKILRPLYDVLVKIPLARAAIDRELHKLAAEPWSAAIVRDFLDADCGALYGVTRDDKAGLVEQFRRNAAEIESGTSPLVHIVLAREVLSIPPDVQGDVIECGAWQGASSASLSLVCSKAGRRLLVCDSFQGLPDDGMRRHTGPHTKVYGYYKEGMFSATLDQVRDNIRQYGSIDVCEFIPGFFAESLKALDRPIAFAFLDVDLVGSMQDCLRHIWPLLVENGLIYSDDAGDMDVVRVFFDEPWWHEHLGCPAPGFVGSGCGLPLNPSASSIGYTRKVTQFHPEDWHRAPFLHYPDEEKV